MKHGVDNEACPVCGEIPYAADRRVLVDGKVQRSFCSQPCLRIGVRMLQMARRKARWQAAAWLVAIVLAAGGAGYVRHLVKRARPPRAAAPAAAPVAPAAAPEPIPFGPHWPPTDAEWQE